MRGDAMTTNRPKGPMGDWREHVKMLGRAIFLKIWSLQVLPALVVGAVLVGGVVGALKDQVQHQELIAPLTAQATGQLEAVWWRLNIDTASLADGATNWAGVTTPSLCARYQFNQTTASACQQYGEILDFTQAPYQLARLSESVGLPWRNAEGAVQTALHFPPGSWDWFTSNITPYAPFSKLWSPTDGHGEEGQLTYWGAFQREFDQPAQYLLTMWQQEPELEIVYDPDTPSQALPLSMANPGESGEGPFVLVMLGFFGLVFWSLGIWLIFMEAGTRFRIAAIVITLALSPWWGNWVWRSLDFVYAGASDFGRMLTSDMIYRPGVVKVMPADYDGEANDVRQEWSLQSSLYGPVFQAIQFTPPATALSENEARARADEQIQASILDMTEDERADLFVLLACYAAEDLRSAGRLFLEVGRYWQADETVGQAAERFVEFQQDGGIRFHNLGCVEAATAGG